MYTPRWPLLSLHAPYNIQPFDTVSENTVSTFMLEHYDFIVDCLVSTFFLCPRFSCVYVVFVSTFFLWATYYSMTVLCEVGIVEDQQLENPFTIVFDVDLIN